MLHYRFHEVSAQRALMHAARSLRENGDVPGLYSYTYETSFVLGGGGGGVESLARIFSTLLGGLPLTPWPVRLCLYSMHGTPSENFTYKLTGSPQGVLFSKKSGGTLVELSEKDHCPANTLQDKQDLNCIFFLPFVLE